MERNRIQPDYLINEIPHLLEHLKIAVARQEVILSFNHAVPPGKKMVKFKEETRYQGSQPISTTNSIRVAGVRSQPSVDNSPHFSLLYCHGASTCLASKMSINTRVVSTAIIFSLNIGAVDKFCINTYTETLKLLGKQDNLWQWRFLFRYIIYQNAKSADN